MTVSSSERRALVRPKAPKRRSPGKFTRQMEPRRSDSSVTFPPEGQPFQRNGAREDFLLAQVVYVSPELDSFLQRKAEREGTTKQEIVIGLISGARREELLAGR